MPGPAEVETPFVANPEAQEVRIRTQHARRAQQLGVEFAPGIVGADESGRQAAIGNARHHQQVALRGVVGPRLGLGGEAVFRVVDVGEQDPLPAATDLGQARFEACAGGLDVAAILLAGAQGKCQPLELGIFPGDRVAQLHAALDLRHLRLGVKAVSLTVELTIEPADGHAGSRVGRVTDTGLVAMAEIALRADGDRRELGFAITRVGQHLDHREVIRVVQGELGPQQQGRVEPVALTVAEVALHESRVEEVLLDQRRAKAVAFPGIEPQGDPRLQLRGIDSDLRAGPARIEVAAARGRALQLALELLVVSMAQLLAHAQRRALQHLGEKGLVTAGAIDDHVGGHQQHWFAGFDGNRGRPAAGAWHDLHLDSRCVVAEGPQGFPCLALGAQAEPVDHVLVQLVVSGEAIEAEEGQHVVA